MEFKKIGFPVKLMAGYLIGILVLTILFSISITHLSAIIREYNFAMRDSWRQLNSLQSLRYTALQIRANIDNDASRDKRDLNRLKKFLEDLQKILSGNYKEKIRDDSKDEVGQIAQGINELAKRLDSKS